MFDYQMEALKRVRKKAAEKVDESYDFVNGFCVPLNVNANDLINNMLKAPITINFHIDRISNNGKSVIENLIEQGIYHGQFRTGTTNGGKTAYIGGDRYLWEQQLFSNAYPEDSLDRPKYGSLNILNYIDGASVRFGSCFFVLKQSVIERCTFAYGDSSENPQIICTYDTFIGVIKGLLEDIQKKERLLNLVVPSVREALAVLLNPSREMKHQGRNLDYCIETHIHGDIILENDVESLYIDESFKDTEYCTQADILCKKYGIDLNFIPIRKIYVDSVGTLFRGQKLPNLAQKTDKLFGEGKGIIDAEKSVRGRATAY